MLNITRMELTRLVKSPVTRGTLVAILVIFLVINIIAHLNLTEMSTVADAESPSAIEISIDKPEEPLAELAHEDLIHSYFSQGSVLILLLVFCSVFFTAPYHHGYIKNFIGYETNRRNLIAADFLAGALFTLVTFILVVAIHILSAQFLSEEGFFMQNLGEFLKLMAVQYYLHLGMVALVLLLATLTQNKSTTLIISLLYSAVLANLIMGVFDRALSLFSLTENLNAADYTIQGSINVVKWGVEQEDILRALIVASVIGLAALIASVGVLKTKDI